MPAKGRKPYNMKGYKAAAKKKPSARKKPAARKAPARKAAAPKKAAARKAPAKKAAARKAPARKPATRGKKGRAQRSTTDTRTPNERIRSPRTASQYEIQQISSQGGPWQNLNYYSGGAGSGMGNASGSMNRTSGNLGTAAARGTGNRLPVTSPEVNRTGLASVYKKPSYAPIDQSGRAASQNAYNRFMYGFTPDQRTHVMREQGVPGLKKRRGPRRKKK